MKVQKGLIILSALFTVLAIALAVDGGIDASLAEILTWADPKLATWLRTQPPAWMVDWIINPTFVRPSWLVPLSLGVLFLGGAFTIPQPKSIGRTRLR